MSEAAASRETAHWAQHYFRQAAASRGERAGGYAGALRLAPAHRSATPLEPCSAPELRIVGGSNDRADHPSTGHLLVIGDDRALMPEQLRRAFPAPNHRVQVAGTVPGGLEHARTDSPDVIILDLDLPGQSGLEVYQQIEVRTGFANGSALP